MIKKSIAPLFLALAFLSAHGQDAPETSSTIRSRNPNIPGVFVFELGFNQPLGSDSLFDIGFWGSRTVNVYYQYNIRLFQSKFSVLPGIGFGFERYKLRNLRTLGYNTTGEVELIPAYTPYPGIKKSMIVTNYIDIPLELRFSTLPDDPARSFRASIGARAGFLYDAFTKIKYKENDETKVLKNKQDFNLNKIRYGAFAKIGAGNFSIFAYYNLSPLFKEDEAPANTDLQNFTVGISLSGF